MQFPNSLPVRSRKLTHIETVLGTHWSLFLKHATDRFSAKEQKSNHQCKRSIYGNYCIQSIYRSKQSQTLFWAQAFNSNSDQLDISDSSPCWTSAQKQNRCMKTPVQNQRPATKPDPTLMVLEGWHLMWWDTLAVWFIFQDPGQHAIHRQSSKMNQR